MSKRLQFENSCFFLSPSILIDEIYIPEICSFLNQEGRTNFYWHNWSQMSDSLWKVFGLLIYDLFCPLCLENLESHQTFFEWRDFTCHTQILQRRGKKYFIQKCKLYLLNLFWVHFFSKGKTWLESLHKSEGKGHHHGNSFLGHRKETSSPSKW